MDIPDTMEAGLKEVLASFTEDQMNRFKAIFASVFERVQRNGGEEEEAQGIALGIALSAARNFTPPALNASLEEETHTFTIMAPEQLGRNSAGAIAGQEYSFEFLKANLDIAKAIAVGNTFNLDHEHDEPVGVITDVLLASDVEGVDQDIPFVYVASYFKDTPDDIKTIDSVSAEWAHFDINGQQEAFPNTFAVTTTPLNGKVQGLKKLAAIEGKSYKGLTSHDSNRDTMPNETETATAAPEFDAEAMQASISDAETRAKEATEELATFKASLAALTGAKEAEEVTAKDLDSIVAGLKSDLEAQTRIVDEIKAAALDKEAEDFTASLIAEGKVSSDATSSWEAHFRANKEMAIELAASLPSKHVGVNEGKAIADLPKDDATLASLDEELMRAMKNGKETN